MSVSKSTIAGIAVAAVLVGGAGFAITSPRALGTKYHQFQITFPTGDGLVAGSDVLEAGSKIGTISDIQPTQDNSALVTVQITEEHWPLHKGLTADIRPKSLLGEKYVDIHDGSTSKPAFDASTVLHENQQAVPVELDQFINSLDAPTRNAARVLLNDLGAGVAGRGQSLNEAIAAGKSNLANLAVFGTTLNNRDPDLDRILVGLDGVLSKITTSDQLGQLSQLITNGQKTLNAIETQQTAFSRQFVDAQTALGELNTAIDSAVPSLRTTLNIAPQLLQATSQEANLLAFLGSKANNHTVLSALDQGLIQGPSTTGGAIETTNGGNPQPIFRICLVNPNMGGSSCVGSGYSSPGAYATPASFDAGQSDMNVLAAWMGA
ncbi:MAG: MCE family protein [Candidatus Dormibacteraeota bacterium]|uniref:MCE family protein n=1 Tax=Candidatus Aeolococcus gillhamiae TaxID=3127015 RepID=A0A934JPN7_9BACT|nr:MCE family protein [Candidatus Dormibacteraeota bacterium]